MDIIFKNSYIERLCKEPNFAKKEMSPKEVKALGMLIYKLMAFDDLSYFEAPENWRKHRIEKLQGNLNNLISLRLREDGGYRMIIECTNTDIKDEYRNMSKICIINVSKHKY